MGLATFKKIVIFLLLTASLSATSLEELFSYTETEKNDPFLWLTIGDSLLQYNELPQAVFAYHKALQLDPNNQTIREQLQNVQEMLGVKPAKFSTGQALFPYFQNFLPWLITSLLIVACFYPRLLPSALLTALVAFIFLSTMHYFIPLQGVLVEPATLYSQSREDSVPVALEPVWAGNILRILDVQEKGTWLKVETNEGNIGFIHFHAIRL